ncbi:peptide ABC transporter substrate-binding protein [Streptomyces inusitatus]|uniref:Peptide ABC transporter substrate-binding protein n=1 Tax=Streptomyces inusitatus TaxID=68221 RepID=A0A918US25_9ACTN|nr:ABC transporter substrate-binding protein [Streptomyces inusitatus]GGZ29439.1 peptide ABC transporter substrate-binding protein [Streptomyces inusitatus]
MRGGTFTYAAAVGTSCLDPHTSPGDITAVVQRNVFDSLVHLDDRGRFHPWLATSWKISDDARSYTFELRDDVTFHDGTPFDAAAVKANLEHIRAPATKSLYAAALLGPYRDSEILGEHRIRIDFAEPSVPFLQAASTPYLGIASPVSLSRDKDRLCAGGKYSVGSGPFRSERYVKNDRAEFVRNADYRWSPKGAAHQGPPLVDRLVVRFLPEDSVRAGALTSGQVDAAAVPITSARAVRRDSSLKLTKRQAPGAAYALYLNTGRGPLRDERVRRALQRSVDVDALIRGVYRGEYERAWSPLSPATPGGYDDSIEGAIRHDPQGAAALLDRAGWTGRDGEGYRTKDGRRLSLRWPYIGALIRDQRDVLAEAVQAELRKNGIDLVREAVETGAYFERYGKGDYDVWDNAWVRADPAILAGFYLSAQRPAEGGQNVSGANDPQVDAWLRAGAAEKRPQARETSYAKVERWAVDHGTVLPLYVPVTAIGTGEKARGLTFDANAWPQFAGVWKTER